MAKNSGAYANPTGVSAIAGVANATSTGLANQTAGGGEEEIEKQTTSQQKEEAKQGSFIDDIATSGKGTDNNPSWNNELKARIDSAPNEARQARLEKKLEKREGRQHDRAERIKDPSVTKLDQKLEKKLAAYTNSYAATNQSAAQLAKEELNKKISGNQSLKQLPRTEIKGI